MRDDDDDKYFLFFPGVNELNVSRFSSAVISAKLRNPLNYTGPSRQSSVLFPR